MMQEGVLRPSPTPGLVHPMGAQVKSSDRVRARVMAGIDITDQASLLNASAQLQVFGLPKVKCRVTLDPTATGLSDASLNAPFRYPSVHDLLDLITPRCHIAITDIARYFHSFPLCFAVSQTPRDIFFMSAITDKPFTTPAALLDSSCALFLLCFVCRIQTVVSGRRHCLCPYG
jgi:hypothetical protein